MKLRIIPKSEPSVLTKSEPSILPKATIDNEVSIVEPPLTHEGLTVYFNWIDIGGKPINGEIVTIGTFRLLKGSKGVALLCSSINCNKLFNCADHNLNNRLYRKCQHINCDKIPRYGYHIKRQLYCPEHKLPRMFNTAMPKCSNVECFTQASYGNRGGKLECCLQHKTADMIDLRSKRCEEADCDKVPSFNYEGERPIFCASHKKEGMINITCRKCQYPNCGKVPCFGLTGCKPQYCFAHKLEGMYNVVDKLCLYPDCKTTPSCGNEGGRPQYCKAHKLPGMKNVVTKRCAYENCDVCPSFNIPGAKAKYCATHKTDDMIDIYKRFCKYPECVSVGNFGYEGQEPDFCSKHKSEGMIDLKCRRCKYEDCMIRPCFGFEHMRPKYCTKHKLEGMTDVTKEFCEYADCTTQPIFGYEGSKPRCCFKHKLEGMEDVKNIKCIFEGCKIRPCYSKLFIKGTTYCRDHATLNDFSFAKCSPICCVIGCRDKAVCIIDNDNRVYPIRCIKHKLIDDVVLIQRRCNRCNEDVYYPENKEMCMNCGLYRVKSLYHFKEQLVRDFLLTNGQPIIHDKRINNSGSLVRPDFLIYTKFGYLLLEVDEFQHKTIVYTTEYEEARMKKLYQDSQMNIPGKQILFVRFNPDPYQGVQFAPKDRLEYLFTLIKYFENIDNIGTNCGKLYLFYDKFTGQDIKIIPVDHENITTEPLEELQDNSDD